MPACVYKVMNNKIWWQNTTMPSQTQVPFFFVTNECELWSIVNN